MDSQRMLSICRVLGLLGAALLLGSGGHLPGQDSETFLLQKEVSKGKTVAYRRVIRYDRGLTRVRDYFANGQIQMEASYRAFDKNVKEDYPCNYRGHTKEGAYRQWYPNGQLEYRGSFRNGWRHGPSTSWYDNGQREAEEHWRLGQLHGAVKYWSERGELTLSSTFDRGVNRHPRNVHYRYLVCLPRDYDADPARKWPLVIYLHGGSRRGNDLKKLYADGIPDQVYRGREFPFVVVAPQCPEQLRWTTDHWFENLFAEVTAKFRIDLDRVYLTGPSLGGEGTWFLAAKYPGKFAAIAPLCGFTGTIATIERGGDRLRGLPIWAFHGERDTVVACAETERMIRLLACRNGDVKFSRDPGAGHEIPWAVYPGRELYDWLLQHSLADRR